MCGSSLTYLYPFTTSQDCLHKRCRTAYIRDAGFEGVTTVQNLYPSIKVDHVPDFIGTLLWNHSTFIVTSETGINRHSKWARWPSLISQFFNEEVNMGAWVVTSSSTSRRWNFERSSRWWICSRPTSFCVSVNIWAPPVKNAYLSFQENRRKIVRKYEKNEILKKIGKRLEIKFGVTSVENL